MRLNDTIYTYYIAIRNGTGYSINDEIVKVEQVNTLDDPTLILETKWFNQTTYLEIYQIVDPFDVDLQLNNSVTVAGGVAGLTDAELRATPVPVSGSVAVSNMIAAVETGLNKEVTQLQVRDRLPVNLRSGRLDAADTFTSGEALPDQNGAGAVLTFTFANPVDLVWVKSDVLDSRADPFSGTPTASQGIPCEAGIPQPITVRTTVVKVFAPLTASVKVWGFSYF